MSLYINDRLIAGKGLPGLSPYQVAKAGGFQGTEEEFNRQLAQVSGVTFVLPIELSEVVSAKIPQEKFTNLVNEYNKNKIVYVSFEGIVYNLVYKLIDAENTQFVFMSLYKEAGSIIELKKTSSETDAHLTFSQTNYATQDYVNSSIGEINTSLDEINGEVI